MNEPRPGKKLLVLDIDYTLFGKYIVLVLFCLKGGCSWRFNNLVKFNLVIIVNIWYPEISD